ncbi:AbrB family transcriptional regulator [Peptoniphilus sp. MSJ-1]|uniref:AbrB family transcriptional regulator n=1 Tax=Peptoniphilus ovalis TaxID=2841503 RepID=A0ABS6FDR3_9FIRM|nr:AbrB family transcriptional regulator [Peptoniphilus ovalis]MBU5668319.1 AbrB family transcriptional regulator [Peptoniphilus ovalis]
MLIAQIEKLGDSYFIKLPEKYGKKLEVNNEYFVEYKDDGNIILIPKLEDSFKKAKFGELYEKEVWGNFDSMEEEL